MERRDLLEQTVSEVCVGCFSPIFRSDLGIHRALWPASTKTEVFGFFGGENRLQRVASDVRLELQTAPTSSLSIYLFSFFFVVFFHRWWYNEQEACVSQRSWSSGPPGLAVQKEGGQRLPGYQMEEVLVCSEENSSVLVHQSAGE